MPFVSQTPCHICGETRRHSEIFRTKCSTDSPNTTLKKAHNKGKNSKNPDISRLFEFVGNWSEWRDLNPLTIG